MPTWRLTRASRPTFYSQATATARSIPTTSESGCKPLVEEVGAPWAGFHTFRRTFASIHLGEGTNLVALSRALGHHSPAFTLSRYTHLLPGEVAEPLDIDIVEPHATDSPAEGRPKSSGSMPDIQQTSHSSDPPSSLLGSMDDPGTVS